MELVDTPPPAAAPRRRRLPAAAVAMYHPENSAFRRPRRSSSGDRSPFNPVIVLRGPSENPNPNATFELFYDDGSGSGLQPLPASMSDFLMGSGFDRLLDQLALIEINGVGGRAFENPPASKSAVESMPTVEILESHVCLESHCAICKEAFDLGGEAKEMPCKHIYHEDCILPWLSMRNSCPVCRHEMPAEAPSVGGEEEAVGLTIWRLPGGGFAVGRFAGGRRAGEREFPVVYTEMDGGLNSGGAPRRISWSSRGSHGGRRGGVGRAFRGVFSLLGRIWGSSSSSSSASLSSRAVAYDSESSASSSRRGSMFSRRSSNGRVVQ